MTPEQIRAVRRSLAMTQADFGRLVLGEPNTGRRPDPAQVMVSRWERGAGRPGKAATATLRRLAAW